ncbi:Abi family protein [Anaerosporobacter sp.]|uniref:Abi family protein n=1 Tax=Anaerosporobacter sp. TaxID=1872529 RepID=UPI00286F3915|nr:Abi family protein [Anaerosporobacter sp.]
MDYRTQIQHLKNKRLIIEDDNLAITILNKIGYYGLINGYKCVFKDNNTNKYIIGTTFHDIYHMYLFDSDLREVFLKYILIVECNIKSSISYHFSELYGNSMSDYQNYSNFDYGKHQHQIQFLFQKIAKKINGKNISPQVQHHLTLYQDVPLWVLTTDLTIGETTSMYRYLKGHCKTLICNDFHQIGRAELSKMLVHLTKTRNICAHGNRLFNIKTGDSIMDCLAHKKLSIPKTGSLYIYGKSDLFASVISLKYLLDASYFRSFYYELKNIINKYKPTDATMDIMGFPANWISILQINVF